jgi:hypothetical protein
MHQTAGAILNRNGKAAKSKSNASDKHAERIRKKVCWDLGHKTQHPANGRYPKRHGTPATRTARTEETNFNKLLNLFHVEQSIHRRISRAADGIRQETPAHQSGKEADTGGLRTDGLHRGPCAS